MRKILLIVIALFVLAAVVAVGGILYVRAIKPDYGHSTSAAGLDAVAEIWFDSAGVAHVWAQSDQALYFAQGYAHAQERLWQLELFRRVAEGRLAEIFGEGLIETDRFLRTLGMWQAAGLNESLLDTDVRASLEAYAAGVNHRIAGRAGPLPPEFLALRIKPEPWTVRHTLALEKIMAWDLSLYQGSAALTRAVRLLGAEKAKYLMPDDPAWGATIIEMPELPQLPEAAALLLDAASITRASNAWVIGGTRTRSGRPILANDMHLQLRQPGIWYLMALHAPGLDVVGTTLPGVPNVITGHNRAVAWGYTNAMLDDVDFFIERPDPNDSTRYLTPNGYETFVTRMETVRVKGRSTPATFTVRTSRHGPIISDADERLKGEAPVAIRWAALDTTHTLHAIPRFNRARSAAELLAAIPLFDDPHQNVVYADTAGEFGYLMAGRVPVRGARLRPPVLPVPGWTGEWDWQGYLPAAEHPRIHNPATGYVVTANNRQARGALGDLVGSDWEPPYRAMRIREMILAQQSHDAAGVHAMQMDVKDLMAARYQGHAVSSARAAGLAAVADKLAAWNAEAATESEPAAYFYAWYETLRTMVSRTLFDSQDLVPRRTLNAALDSGSIGWLGAAGRTVLDSLARAALLQADSVARGKTWGDLNRVLIVHALAEAPAVEKLLGLNIGPAPHYGSTTTVNVAQYTGRTFPVRTSYGASHRHVVDMSAVDAAGGFILPAGQSGLRGSPHNSDMFERWRNGGLWHIPLDRAGAEARTVSKTVIRPVSQ